jgi:hypothetical protein
MSDMASVAAEAFCDKHTAVSVTDVHIRNDPETYLNYTTPYLTVRTLHRLEHILKRHETALKSLETDSRWIKFLTIALVTLTIALAYYALRLDAVIHRLGDSPAVPQTAAVEPSPPTASPSPTL